jgi:amino acid transporter
MTTVILVMAYGQTRIIFAMSRDGLLPAKLSTVHPKYGTPFFATWMVGIVFGLIAAFVPLNVLAELVNIGTLAAFCLVSVAVDGAAQEASGPEARLPLPGRADRAGHRRGVLPGPDVLPEPPSPGSPSASGWRSAWWSTSATHARVRNCTT